MNKSPLVSVITPTWKRRDLLMNQCIPSVQAQTYPNIEHIIVVDGPGEIPILFSMLRARLNDYRRAFRYPIHLFEMDKNYGIWGNEAKRWALANAAKGDLIAYLDDDDAYEPGHIELLAKYINSPKSSPDILGTDFAYSVARTNWPYGPQYIGYVPPSHGNVTNSALMHRRSLTSIANWRDSAPAHIEKTYKGREIERCEDWHIRNACPDWDLVKRWIEASVGYIFIKSATVVMKPHLARGRYNGWNEI